MPKQRKGTVFEAFEGNKHLSCCCHGAVVKTTAVYPIPRLSPRCSAGALFVCGPAPSIRATQSPSNTSLIGRLISRGCTACTARVGCEPNADAWPSNKWRDRGECGHPRTVTKVTWRRNSGVTGGRSITSEWPTQWWVMNAIPSSAAAWLESLSYTVKKQSVGGRIFDRRPRRIAVDARQIALTIEIFHSHFGSNG
jgi:hypothetical protein